MYARGSMVQFPGDDGFRRSDSIGSITAHMHILVRDNAEESVNLHTSFTSFRFLIVLDVFTTKVSASCKGLLKTNVKSSGPGIVPTLRKMR